MDKYVWRKIIRAKRSDTCVRCRQAYPIGTAIAYDDTLLDWSHVSCFDDMVPLTHKPMWER